MICLAMGREPRREQRAEQRAHLLGRIDDPYAPPPSYEPPGWNPIDDVT